MSGFEFNINRNEILACAERILEKSKKASLHSVKDVINGKFNTAEGVYLFVDVNEDEIKRIVRVGTHTQSDNIGSRLKAHYKGSDSNSVFRKMLRNVLEKKLNSKIKNKTVTEEIQKYKFVFIDTKGFSKDERLKTESKIIATLSWAALLSSSFRDESKDSLFAYADNRTRLFGLWLKDGLLGEPYKNISDIEKLNFRTN